MIQRFTKKSLRRFTSLLTDTITVGSDLASVSMCTPVYTTGLAFIFRTLGAWPTAWIARSAEFMRDSHLPTPDAARARRS